MNEETGMAGLRGNATRWLLATVALAGIGWTAWEYGMPVTARILDRWREVAPKWVKNTAPPGPQASMVGGAVSAPPPAKRLLAVSALGRLEPRRGSIRVAGPSLPAVVISKLRVEEGHALEVGDVIAVLDTYRSNEADVARSRAALLNAERDVERHAKLFSGGVISDSLLDDVQFSRDVAAAQLQKAEAELERSIVRAPINGRVLEVYAREGERVGPEGIVEMGDTDVMYAVAEVYETDIGRVRAGQRARVRSPSLPRVLEGSVEMIHLLIRKKDVLGTDPVAEADARVVEVEIRLDEPQAADAFTNLRVDVEIEPEAS
jgi:HlyD family secretion protein